MGHRCCRRIMVEVVDSVKSDRIQIGVSGYEKASLLFALKNEVIVSIADVSRGLQCGCICPHCYSTLVARKGPKRADHFAHYRHPDCEHGPETALHSLAKEIIAGAHEISIPPSGSAPQIISIDTCEIEANRLVSKVKPDVILNAGTHAELVIEITVTHGIDDQKEARLKAMGSLAMEIQLGRYMQIAEIEVIKFAVLTEISNRRWVVGPQVTESVVHRAGSEQPLAQVKRVSLQKGKPKIPIGFFPLWSSYYSNTKKQADLYLGKV
jgi:hypothetical protein